MQVTWQTALELAQECGFARAALVPATPVSGYVPNAAAIQQRITDRPSVLLDGAMSVLVAAMPFDWHTPWDAGFAEVSAFYFTSQRAHEAIFALAARLSALGARIEKSQNVPQKMLGNIAGLGVQGRNTLLRNGLWGSCFSLRVLVTDIPPQPEVDVLSSPSCGDCRLCMNACPTGALDGSGSLDTERCIRTHMMTGNAVPEWIRGKMGTRLLGCEICQRVCPHNAGAKTVPPEQGAFAIETLLRGERKDLDNLGRAIGWNEARLSRVRAQAALCAGNSGDARYRPFLHALTDDAQPAVAAHARWALGQLKGEIGC